MTTNSVLQHGRYRRTALSTAVALCLLALLFLPHNLAAQTSYTWSGGAGGDWQNASNWTPTRTTTATNDVLSFDNVSATVTNVPQETIGELRVENGSAITLETTGATLTVASANGLAIDDACSLVLAGTNPLAIVLQGNNSAINGSGQLIFSNASTVRVTGILKLNGTGGVDFGNASAVLAIAVGAELQINSTGATVNFDAASSVVFEAATAAGQQPSTLRFANAGGLVLTGSASGVLSFGYYYNSGTFESVQPRILSSTGANAAVLNVTGATKILSLFTNTGGSEGINIPGDLILGGGGTLRLEPMYANQNVRTYGEMFGTNLMTIRSGTTFENRAVLQSGIRMAVEGTLYTSGSLYNSRNISVYGEGRLDIATMNFWTYASLDLYDSSSVRLLSSDAFTVGQLHTYNAVNIHGNNTVFGDTALMKAGLDFSSGALLHFDQNAVLNIEGASFQFMFYSAGAQMIPAVVDGGGSATLNLNTANEVRMLGGFTDRTGFAVDGTLNIQGSAPIEMREKFVLMGSGSGSAVNISTGNSVSVVYGSSNLWAVEGIDLDISGNVSVEANSSLVIAPATNASTNVVLRNSGSLVVDGRLTMATTGSYQSLFDGYGAIAVNGTASVVLNGGSFIVNSTSLTITNDPVFTATTGTLQYLGSSQLEFAGSVAHTAVGELSTTAIFALKMNNSAGVTLSTTTTVTDALNLVQGLLYTSTNTLVLQSSGSLGDASDTSYIVGNFQQYVAMSPAFFPIGSPTKFLPVFAEYNDNGGDILATVNEVNPTIGRSGIASNPVQATWYLQAIGGMPSPASIGFGWPHSAEPAGFNGEAAAPARWTGSAWESYRDNIMFTAEGMVMVADVSSFSPWAVFGGFVPSFATQPSDIVSGALFSPAVQVEILDPTSATRSALDNSTVVVLSHSSDGSRGLTGTTGQTVVNGLATFADLGMAGPQASDMYLIASTQYNSATSATFALIGGAAQLGATAAVPSNPASTEEFEIKVEVQTSTGTVANATDSLVVGATYSNPYLFVLGSTQASIPAGGTSATLAFAFYNSSSASVTTTITISGGELKATTVTITVQAGCANYALNFNNNAVSIADPGVSSLDVTGDVTIELWLRQTSRQWGDAIYTQRIAGKGTGQVPGFYGIDYNGQESRYRMVMQFDGNLFAAATVIGDSVPLGTWTHLAGTYSTAAHAIRVYVNGVLMGETLVDSTWTRNNTHNENFSIGRSSNGMFPVYGAVDEVRVWNVARTAAQISGNRFNRLAPRSAGLAGYWRMDEGTGTTVIDISGNGNHAVNNGVDYVPASTTTPRISGATIACNGDALVYTAPAISGATYNWSVSNGWIISGQSTPQAVVEWNTESTQASLSLTTTGINGCATSTTAIVKPYQMLSVDVGESVELCAGQGVVLSGNVSGGSGLFSYEWTPYAGLDNPYVQNPTAAPQTSTMYTLTVTDTESGCQTTATVEVTVNPIAGSAVQFDGTNYINAGEHAEHIITQNLTLEAWVKPSYSSDGGTIINREGEYELVISNTGTLTWAFATVFPGWTFINTNYPVPYDRWTHIAVVLDYDHFGVFTYINGDLFHAYPIYGEIVDIDPPSNELRIGGRQIGVQPYHGLIDEVRVWNTVRTQQEVQQNMYASLAGNEPGLVAYYPLNEGIGFVANDASVNNIPAAFVNTPVWSPVLRATGATVTCSMENEIYTVAAEPATAYTWSVEGGTIVSSTTTSLTSSVTVLWQAGAGMVRVTAAVVDGCSVSTSMNVTVHQSIAVNAGTNATVCYGGSVVLGGSPTALSSTGTFSYQWTPSAGLDNSSAANPIATPSTTTTYTVVVTNTETGCAVSSSATVTVNPVVSPGLALDGSGDYIEAPAGVWFSGDYTVEGWVNLREASYWARFFDFGNGPNADNIAFILSVDNNGPVAIRHFNGASFSSEVVTPDNLPLNQWVHLAFVLDGTVGRIYKNGELWAEAGGQFIPNNVVRNNNYIGHPNWPDPDTKASFDEIRIWNVARTQEQIRQSMNVSLIGDEAGLQAYYRLDEGRGSLAIDASPNARNAAIAGNPVWESHLQLAGEHTVCGNLSQGRVYSVIPADGAEYNWSVNGGTILSTTASATTNSITVQWQSGAGTVSVTASPLDGCSQASTSMTVQANFAPVVSVVTTATTDEDQTTTLVISISDAETAASSLAVTAISDNEVLLPQTGIFTSALSDTMDILLVPADNQSGTAHITIEVSDGCLVSSTTLTLTVNAVNDAPVAMPSSIELIEDVSTSGTVVAMDMESTSLTYSVVGQGAKGSAAMLSTNGIFTYTPDADANGCDSFVYEVSDGNGGVSTATVSVLIRSVNDAPVFTTGANQVVNEDAGLQTVEHWATDMSAGAGNETVQSLYFAVSNSNPSLFSIQPSISTTGTLVYAPAADVFGTAIVDVVLFDDGGTEDGGVTTSTVQSFAIEIRAVNDAPVFTTGANQIVNEDAGLQTVENWATDISAGAGDESAQSLYFVVSNSNPSLFAVQPSISTSGTLTYTPVADAFGMATVNVVLFDNGGTDDGGVTTSTVQSFAIEIRAVNDAPTFTTGANQIVNEDAGLQTVENWAADISTGADNEATQSLYFMATNSSLSLFSTQPFVSTSGTLVYAPAANAFGTATVDVVLFDNGGTMYSGVTTSTVQSFTIEIRAVNDAPTFTTGANQIVNEDAGLQTVENWATDISAGADNEAAQSLYFVTANSNPSLFSTQPSISTSGTLVYAPAADAFGTAIVDVVLFDNGGTTNGGVTTSTVQSFAIEIRAVNDAPAFITGANQIVNEDAGLQTVENWAMDISAGAGDEAAQMLHFVVSNSNSSLFAVQPSISTSGTLVYTPAADTFGTAIVAVVLFDNGGTMYSGVTTSTAQSFTIEIRAVNDAPTFTTGANQFVNEDSGLQIVENWATGMSAGPANESEQSIAFAVSNNNSALFAVAPAVSSTGTLSYAPAADISGTAVVTIYAMDNGGTLYGGVSTSTVQTFSITVNAVNDAPVARADIDTLCSGSAIEIAVLVNDTDIEQNTLSIGSVAQGSKGTVSILPGNTSIVYTPLGGEMFGWDSFTYTAVDGNGGSSTATVSVFILPPVVANAGADTTVCSGSSIMFSGIGISYIGAIKFEWSPATGVSNPLIADPIVTPTTTTTYTLTVTDGFGCSATDQITISVLPASATSVSTDTTICAGAAAILEAAGGVSYEWSPAAGLSSTTASAVTASPSTTTTYTVLIQTAGGCTISRFVTVTVVPVAVADAGADITLCGGGSAQLEATGGASYEWSPATGLSNAFIANPIATPATTTTYVVTVRTAGGCESSDTVTVTVLPLALDVRVLLEGPAGENGMLANLRNQGLVPESQPYNGEPFNYAGAEVMSTTNDSVVDWVLVELRAGVQANTMLGRKAALLLADGRIVESDGGALHFAGVNTNSSYHIVVHHRNHLGVMSATAVAAGGDCTVNYNFTASATSAYSVFMPGQKQVGVNTWGMISGDVDADGLVNAVDRVMVRNESGLLGYRATDLSLDGIVNAVDRVMSRNNTFRARQVP